MHSPGFEKYNISKNFACDRLLFSVFAYLMRQFSKIFQLQRAFNRLLVIIVVNNSNVKKTYYLEMMKLRYTFFSTFRPLFMDFIGSVKIFSGIFLVKGG